MMLASKVHAVLYQPTNITTANSKQIQISPTKHEPLFSAFADSSSQSSRLVKEISESSALRQFLFLESTTIFRPDSPNGNSITYPICLDPLYNFTERKVRIDYKERLQKLIQKKEKTDKVITSLMSALASETFQMILEEPNLARFRGHRSGNLFEEFTKTMMESFDKKPHIFRNFTTNISAISETAYEIQILRMLESFSGIADTATTNSQKLNQIIPLPHGRKQLETAFSIMPKYDVHIKIESICLDCYYEYGDSPFMSILSGVRSVELLDHCQRCKGTGIIHTIGFGMPRGLSKLVMPESSWIYELIIGHSIANLDFIKDVYVHKNVHGIAPEGALSSGMEVDVIALTENDKLEIIEVTTQSDLNNLIQNIEGKCKRLDSLGIPYDKVMYFTAADMDQYLDIGNTKARIFGLRHLYKLEEFVKHYVKPTTA